MSTTFRYACVGCGKVFKQDLSAPENHVTEDLLRLCPDVCRVKALEDLQNSGVSSDDAHRNHFGK